jgi:hypothetical protein
MAYCVKCGVELAEYSKSCPLCRTEVADSAVLKETENIDYPNYRTPSLDEAKRVNRIFVGRLLSMMFLNYAVILIIINLSVNKAVTWSLIPVISIALVWFGVAFPFYKKRSTFFELYTYDSIAVILYVIGLNLLISGDVSWAKYAALSVGLIWAVLAGFFIGGRIRKALPVIVFYIVIAVIFFAAFAFAINNRLSAFRLIMPIMGVVLAVALFSYFIITARAGGILGILWVVFVSVSVLSLGLDAIISNYIAGHVALTWSLIVNAVTVPMFVTSLTVKKSRELKAIITKRLHR